MRKLITAAGLVLLVAGCGGAAHKADKYCPGVMHVLPRSAPHDYQAALNDINQLVPVIPPGNDNPLDSRLLAVERALDAIGKADVGAFRGASTDQIAAFYTSTARVRAYCRG